MQFQLTTATRSICVIAGCGRPTSWRGLCRPHYDKRRRTGVEGGELKPRGANGTGYRRVDGYLAVDVDGRKRLEHVVIAERALGKPLPKGAQVHHVDEDPTNNAPSNLVVCPDAAYHKLLHQRQRAFDACGHYDWRKCKFCGQYDAPENLWTNRKTAAHRACSAAARRAYYDAKKGQACSNS